MRAELGDAVAGLFEHGLPREPREPTDDEDRSGSTPSLRSSPPAAAPSNATATPARSS